MTEASVLPGESATRDVILFRVGEILCGLGIEDVQEIKKLEGLTHVFLAPSYVKGVINLRGQIVTIIDLRTRFDLEPQKAGRESWVVVVRRGEEYIGLLVDEVDDVVGADADFLAPPPGNLSGIQGHFFAGILQMEGALVALLDRDRIIGDEVPAA